MKQVRLGMRVLLPCVLFLDLVCSVKIRADGYPASVGVVDDTTVNLMA